MLGFFASQDIALAQSAMSAADRERIRPRPTPPECCRPFRAVDVLDGSTEYHSIAGGGSVFNIPTNTVTANTNVAVSNTNANVAPRLPEYITIIPRIRPASSPVESPEAYRKSLEVYRAEVEWMYATNQIVKFRYDELIKAYKDRIKEYKKVTR